MEYTKITSDIFLPVTISPVPLLLSDLKNRLLEMQAAAVTVEPSEAELLDFARMVHPFYSDALQRAFEIQRLQNLITELEGL
jgi:hypothetical protein